MPEFKKICLLDKSDVGIELVPEAYIESKIPTLNEIESGVEEMIKKLLRLKLNTPINLRVKNSYDNNNRTII